ncbi:T9SS type A sorting domain-containing protein [bacterium]|nr:T9SS type A sorting domain-containing protein [bacterium]
MKRFLCVLSIVFLTAGASSLTAEFADTLNIYIMDCSGPMNLLVVPDSMGVEYETTPAFELLNSILTLNSYSSPVAGEWMLDSVSVDVGTELPSLDAYDIIFLTTGWPSSGGRVLAEWELDSLISFIDPPEAPVRGKPRGLFIEGNDFAYNHGDTSALHSTYHPIFDYLACLLLDTAGPHFTILRGVTGSLAEGLDDIIYYGTEDTGPRESVDDIDINPESPAAPYASLVFTGVESKSPARGMQRRSFPPLHKDTEFMVGATVYLPFIFGNIDNSSPSNIKLYLMARILNFLIPPRVKMDTTSLPDTFYIGGRYPLTCFKHDNFEGATFFLSVSYDSMSTLDTIATSYSGPDEAVFTVDFIPDATTDNLFFQLSGRDIVGNNVEKIYGPFVVTIPTGIETPQPDKVELSAYPNPFNQTVIIRTGNGETVSVYNVEGKLVAKIPTDGSTARWTPKDLPAGVYIARMDGNGRTLKLLFLR